MSLADWTEHSMPSGARCFYRDSDHSYFSGIEPKLKSEPDGEWKGIGRLTGVSTAASPADFRPDALLRWSAQTTCEGIAKLFNSSCAVVVDDLDWLESAGSIWRELREAGLTHEDVRDQAAERGISVHRQALHELALGGPVPAYEEMTEKEHGYAQGVAAFWLEHDPVPEQAEQVVMDPELRVAGRLDLRARLGCRCGRPGCPCGALTLGDFFLLDAKTGFLTTKAQVQLAGYEWCSIQSGFGPTHAQFLLQLYPNGDYNLVSCRATAADFMAFLDAYRRSGRIGSATRADRKGREAT